MIQKKICHAFNVSLQLKYLCETHLKLRQFCIPSKHLIVALSLENGMLV